MCWEPMPVTEAIIVASVMAAEDGPGGTAMIAEFHPACIKLSVQ